MRRRLAPVIFAVAYAVYWGSFPAIQAKYISTAYSGRTATSAKNASASACGISSCATSEAHESRNAAPKTPMPLRVAIHHGGRSGKKKGNAAHCRHSTTADTSQMKFPIVKPIREKAILFGPATNRAG